MRAVKLFAALCAMLAAACEGPAGPQGTEGSQGPAGAVGAEGAAGKIGPQGPIGTQGPAGPQGLEGPVGPAGPQGTEANVAACMTPCHGKNGIRGMAQWQLSGHARSVEWLADAAEQKSWTSKTSSCGGCHAQDGPEARATGKMTVLPGNQPPDLLGGQLGYVDSVSKTFKEAMYGGNALAAALDCWTCHKVINDTHATGKKYTIGDWKFWTPVGPSDPVIIEKNSAIGATTGTPVKYQRGNVCIGCHKARKDVTNYIVASNKMSSSHWGPHEAPQADVYTGKGGYEFAGKSYGSSFHAGLKDGCVTCHPDHSFKPKLLACVDCHVSIGNFNVLGGQTLTKKLILELRGLLSAANVLELDTTNNPALDGIKVSTPPVVLDAEKAGALWNYLLIARGKDNGVHNPRYTRQLLYDSISLLKGAPPVDLTVRP